MESWLSTKEKERDLKRELGSLKEREGQLRVQRDHVVRELCNLDTERRRLKSLEGRMSLSGSKGTSKNTSKSRKRVEKVRRIEVTFVDDNRSNDEGSGGDTDRII